MHLRDRYLVDIINKRTRAWPLVGILGARQTGKSTLLRELISKEKKIPYFTLDRPEVLKQIKSKTESFVLAETDDFTKRIIIDEAHKVPKLFDVLKVLADEKKTRGIITITGSVDFSVVTGIRETLTGRIGICRLYPMTIGELKNKKFNSVWQRKKLGPANNQAILMDIETWIRRGGMPGICWLNDDSERSLVIEEWLQSICYRDLLQLKGARFDGSIAREVLSVIAKDPEVTPAEIASDLGIDARTVTKHLNGLESLYVVNRIKPLKRIKGVGYDRFYLLDAGVASYLGASSKTLYSILMINETLAQHEYLGILKPDLYFYASRGKTKLDLIIKSSNKYYGFVLSDKAEQSSYQVRSLETIAEKNFFDKVSILAPVTREIKLGRGVTLESIASYC